MTPDCVEDFAHVGLPTDCEAVLLMETDGHPAAVADEAARMEEIAAEQGAREVRAARDEAEALALAAAQTQRVLRPGAPRPTTILEDVTVPRSELATMITFIAETARGARPAIGTFGHMGDGNLHPTFLTDERDEDEMTRVELRSTKSSTKPLELGGTITGEHGIGLAKKAWLPAADRRQQLRADAADQARARSRRPSEPRQDFRLIRWPVRPLSGHMDYSVLQQCMHCGMCLPTCPTYDATKRERNSPRGRIALMRAVAEGELDVTRFADEMSYCLGCLACQTACPAGVNYAELFETARSDIETRRRIPGGEEILARSDAGFSVPAPARAPRSWDRQLRLVQRSRCRNTPKARRLRLTRLLPATLRRLEPQTPRIGSARSSAR